MCDASCDCPYYPDPDCHLEWCSTCGGYYCPEDCDDCRLFLSYNLPGRRCDCPKTDTT